MRIRKETDNMNSEELELVAKASDALAHPARVAIFRYIYAANMRREPVCNKSLVEAFGYAQSTVSQHMSKLTGSGLVEVQKKGPAAFYYVNVGLLAKYLGTVKKLNEQPAG